MCMTGTNVLWINVYYIFLQLARIQTDSVVEMLSQKFANVQFDIGEWYDLINVFAKPLFSQLYRVFICLCN